MAINAAPLGGGRQGVGSQDAALDEHLLDRPARHGGVATDDALLGVEALTLVGLGDSADPGRSRRIGQAGQGG